MSFRPPKTLPIISIFHNAQNPLSREALSLVQTQQRRPSGEDIYRVDLVGTDVLPTKDQLHQMASYLEGWKPLLSEEKVSNTNNIQDAQDILLKDPTALKRPIVVDWSNGKAAVGLTSLSTIKALLQQRVESKT